MPGKKHVRGVSAKEQRQYEHIKKSAEESRPLRRPRQRSRCRHGLKQHKEKGTARGINSVQSKAGVSKVIEEPLYCALALIRARVGCDTNSIGG